MFSSIQSGILGVLETHRLLLGEYKDMIGEGGAAVAFVPPVSWFSTVSRMYKLGGKIFFGAKVEEDPCQRKILRLIGTSASTFAWLGVLFFQKVLLFTQPTAQAAMLGAFVLTAFNAGDTFSQ